MIWCLFTLAVLAVVAGMGVLWFRLPRLDPTRLRPGRLLRGCVATVFVLAALGLAGIGLVLILTR